VSLVIVGADVGAPTLATIRIAQGRIVDVSPDGTPERDDEVIDARGGAVIPGLHDHHIHLRALAAAAASVTVGPPRVRTHAELVAALQAADATLPPGAWIRATGYHESVAGSLGRAALDALVASRPVRVQHRSGALWMLNTAALRAVGLSDDHDGRLGHADDWLREVTPAVALDFVALSARAAAFGVTGFTDATPNDARGVAQLAGAVATGAIRQRVHAMTALDCQPGSTPHPRFTTGPVKLLLHDETLPAIDELAATIVAAHDADRPVAVHCVTRLQLIATVAALDTTGTRAGDRIEHGAVVPVDTRADLKRLGVVIVTQPNFVAERGDDYRADVTDEDPDVLYPCRSLIDEGIAMAGGTDAPFGDADPWAAMRAAVDRTTASGAPLGPAERVDAGTALRLFLGSADAPAVARRVEPGTAADLCLLHAPLVEARRLLSAEVVALTIVDGEIVAAK
jgi:predicted amidohydrolase YtcJ